jgi:hypothetical protein
MKIDQIKIDMFREALVGLKVLTAEEVRNVVVYLDAEGHEQIQMTGLDPAARERLLSFLAKAEEERRNTSSRIHGRADKLMPHELPHESPDDHDLLQGLPKMAEGNGPIDMTPAALIASLKSDIILMKKHTTTAKGTAISPMVYVWKNGFCRVTVLKPSPGTTLTFTPESLGLMASGMGKGPEAHHVADAVGLIYDARGEEMPRQAFRDQPVSLPGQKWDAWAALLRIREGDRLWSCAQTYSHALTSDAVIWGVRLIWDSATDPNPTHREMFQLPAWYPVPKAEGEKI